MELVKHTTHWVNGEVLQGKIMIAIAGLLIVAWVAIFRSNHELLRGALIPMSLIVLVLAGYGGHQVINRPGHVNSVIEQVSKDQKGALEKEKTKAQTDHRVFSVLTKVWPVLIIVSALLMLVFSDSYYKGLGIGLIALFSTLLIIDSVLHHRLQLYTGALNQL